MDSSQSPELEDEDAAAWADLDGLVDVLRSKPTETPEFSIASLAVAESQLPDCLMGATLHLGLQSMA